MQVRISATLSGHLHVFWREMTCVQNWGRDELGCCLPIIICIAHVLGPEDLVFHSSSHIHIKIIYEKLIDQILETW